MPQSSKSNTESSSSQAKRQLRNLIDEAIREQGAIDENNKLDALKRCDFEQAVGDSYMLHNLRGIKHLVEILLNKKDDNDVSHTGT